MLLYNSKKIFLGVDEATLRSIGYNTLEELREDVEDFADLFDKKPGFIHNFKNFSWIDFLIHSDKKDVKAHIRCNGKVHSASFKVETFFLTNDETKTEKGFLVKLKNLELIGDDAGSAPRDIFEPELPQPILMPDLNQTQAHPVEKPLETQTLSHADSMPEVPDDSLLPDLDTLPELDDEIYAPLDLSPEVDMAQDEVPQTMDINLEDIHSYEPEETLYEPQKSISEGLSADVPAGLITPKNYIYNPSVAADELGLPADLIDEFVGDFIVQAKKFRPEMEEAIANEDFDTVQILSHKLKGVAANLRIENALEVLTAINQSQNSQELKSYSNYLFSIISQLEFGAEPSDHEIMASITVEEPSSAQVFEPEEEEMYPHSIETSANEDIYDFNLIHDEDREKELQELSALADELSSEAEELPPLISHDETAYEERFETAVIEERVSAPVDIPVLTPPLEPAPETSRYDADQTASELGMDAQDLHIYIQEFVDQANGLKTELENALKSRNFEKVRTIATELKGASEALHMNYASSLLTQMQTSDDIRDTINNAKAFFIFVRQL